MSELKPCPFCGGKAELVCAPGYFKTGLSSSGWFIKCLNGCCNQTPYGSDHDAIEAWNRRAGDAPTTEPERTSVSVNEMPSAQTEYDILGWLLAYHTKSFDLHGRYMPHEVIGWLVHDFANAYMAERREE